MFLQSKQQPNLSSTKSNLDRANRPGVDSPGRLSRWRVLGPALLVETLIKAWNLSAADHLCGARHWSEDSKREYASFATYSAMRMRWRGRGRKMGPQLSRD